MYELIRAGPFFVGVFVGGQYPKSIPAQQNPPEKKRVRRFTEKKNKQVLSAIQVLCLTLLPTNKKKNNFAGFKDMQRTRIFASWQVAQGLSAL